MSRSVLHFLLSLVLLVSQQLAFAHGLSHWDELRQQAQVGQSGHGHGVGDGSEALHDFCAECAFDAQLDFALPLSGYAVPAAESVAVVSPQQGVEGVLQAPLRPYQSRAPPRAN